MPVALARAKESEKEIIDNLLQLYLHELSKFDDYEIGSRGRYSYGWLDCYWHDERRHPYIVTVKGKLAGFVLAVDEEDGTHTVAEFFILEGYRRLGIGEEIARSLFCMHPGPWRVSVLAENETAILFWRNVIRRFSLNTYQEAIVPGWMGPVFRFESSGVDPEPRLQLPAERHLA